MAVQEQTPLREYTANGVTTSFALGFDCEETNHLIVTIDDVEVLPTDWYLSGSNVIFWTAPGNGKLIKLQRNTPFNRLADYQSYNNSFRPPAINKEFDRIWWKLQELGVADWILHNRIDALKAYVDQQDSELQQNIDNLKIYVDDKDDELRAYLLAEIQKQGVALDQLDEYYNYLMQRLAQIAIDKGWEASFVVSAGGDNQQEINDRGGSYWREKPLGYDINSRVMLDNGDIVRSTIAGNTVDPNVDMTGWFNESNSQRKTVEKTKRDNETIYDYGAVGDGTIHTVQEWYTVGATHYRRYSNLAAVQADYPFVTDNDFSADQAAILKLAHKRASTGGGTVDLSIGEFIVKPINNGACLPMPGKVTLVGRGDGTILHEITPINDDPNTAVSWDLVLFSGEGTVGGGAKDFTVKHTGGRRSNTASIATRAGAVRQKYRNINFESTIGSSIVIEYSVANPKPTFCHVSGITSKPASRHSVYISGASHNVVTGNIIYLSALEGVAIRGDSRNRIANNDFIGVEGVRTHAVCLAQPPSNSKYKYYGLTLEGNRGHNLFGAGFYGQGNGCELYDSDVSGNDWELSVTDPLVTHHHMMFYRTYRSKISNNVCRGGRNRGIMLYGSSRNDLTGNTLHNVIGSGTAAIGAIGLASYKDIDDNTYYSTDNKLIGNKIIDDREAPLMKIGIQMSSGCVRNLVSKTEFEGIQTKIDSADGLMAQNIGIDTENLIFNASKNTGTNTPENMKYTGNNSLAYVSQNAFIKSFRISVQELTISGKTTARLYKNGGVLVANVFTADNLSKTRIVHFQPNQYSVSAGDTINIQIETEDLTSGQSALSFSAEVVLAQ